MKNEQRVYAEHMGMLNHSDYSVVQMDIHRGKSPILLTVLEVYITQLSEFSGIHYEIV